MNRISSKNIMVRGFFIFLAFNLCISSFHFMAWVTAPFDSKWSAIIAWQLFFLFQAVFLITSAYLCSVFNNKNLFFCGGYELERIDLRWLSVLAAIGLGFHIFAKYPILEQVELGCLSSLRSTWISYDKGLDPTWRRAMSMLGYVFSHLAMPIAFISAFRLSVSQHDSKNWLYFIFSIFIITMFALVIVSRMMMLTALAVVVGGCLFALLDSRSSMRIALRKSCVVVFVAMSIVFCVGAFVAMNRINCSGNDVIDYVSSNIKDANAKWNEGGNLKINSTVYLPIVHYLNHGIWNVAQITATEERGSDELFSFAKHYLSRMGFQLDRDEPNKRVFSAGGIGLAGASFHDYGWIGVILVAVALGFLLVFTLLCLSNRRAFWAGFVIFPGLIITMTLQFLFVGPSTISFPFTTLAFLIAVTLHLQLSKRCS